MKFGIVVFPGSNCDRDCFYTATELLGEEACYIWHKETEISGIDCIIIPGGFSYGDYLRAGAIATSSPIIKAIAAFAGRGGLIVGICNGFQVLTETRLLPGALIRNRGLNFVCRDVFLKVENNRTPFTSGYIKGDVVKMPIAHMDGNYFADEGVIKSLNENAQVVFRYCTKEGEVTDAADPNGSMENIAGICNRKGNVLGMMPHPERCAENILGGLDGRALFESIARALSF